MLRFWSNKKVKFLKTQKDKISFFFEWTTKYSFIHYEKILVQIYSFTFIGILTTNHLVNWFKATIQLNYLGMFTMSPLKKYFPFINQC